MQIKSKFIATDAIDGSKLKLKKDEAVRGTKQDGTEVELIKLDGSDKVLLKGQEAALKSQVDAEEAARIAGDAATLSSAQSYADAKVAALVNSAPAVLDTLKELSDALGSDPNFATTVAGQIAAVQAEVDAEEVARAAAVAAVQAEVDAEEVRAAAAEAALSASISAETTRATAAEAALAADIAGHESRLDVMDIIDTTESSTAFENAAGVYADARPGSQDPSHREGWYFKNAGPVGTAQNKVNWYFFDGQAENVTLGDFSGYAVVTMDSLVSKPHMAVYTVPGASGNAASWYRSKKTFIINPADTVVAGKKYLVYFGSDPKVHPELPRLQMIVAPAPSAPVGPLANSERVLTAVFGSDSATAINNCQFVAESLGVFSPSVKRKISLRIRKASQSEVEAYDSRLDIIEGAGEGSVAKAEADAKAHADSRIANSTKQELFTITSEMLSAGFITLSHKTLVENSLVMHLGRLALFDGEDFTISTNASGYAVLTFAGELLPAGNLALEVGDQIRAQYMILS